MLNLKEQHRHGGGIDLKFAGNFYNGYFDANNTKFNTLVLKYRYRESGGTWSNYTKLALNTDYSYGSGNTYSSSNINLGTEFDYQKKYEFQLSYADQLSSATFTQTVKEGEPTFDFGKDSSGNNYFNVNGEIYKNGQKLVIYPRCIYINASKGVLVSLNEGNLYRMVNFEIIGNGYGSSAPFLKHIQGYHYKPQGNFIHCKQQNISGSLPICKFKLKNGKIALWIPFTGLYTSLIIKGFITNLGSDKLAMLTDEFYDSEPSADATVGCTLGSIPPVATGPVNNVDANNYTTFGQYHLATGCTNTPEGREWIQLLVLGNGGNCVQIATVISSFNPLTWIRTRNNGTWGTWKRLSVFGDETTSNAKMSSTIHATAIKNLEIGGIYEISIVYNHNTDGNVSYRSVIYGILSLPCRTQFFCKCSGKT